MNKIIRFGVSLGSNLLENFDEHCLKHNYQNRSEAIRDLIRNALVEDEWEADNKTVAGCLVIIYDHHISNLSQRLIAIQHDFHDCILATTHVHLDHDNCLESIVLKGSAERLRKLSNTIIATKGVKFGKLNLATTGQDIG